MTTAKGKKERDRAAEHARMLEQALNRPGVKEVMEVYSRLPQIEEFRSAPTVPREVYVVTESDRTSWCG